MLNNEPLTFTFLNQHETWEEILKYVNDNLVA